MSQITEHYTDMVNRIRSTHHPLLSINSEYSIVGNNVLIVKGMVHDFGGGYFTNHYAVLYAGGHTFCSALQLAEFNAKSRSLCEFAGVHFESCNSTDGTISYRMLEQSPE